MRVLCSSNRYLLSFSSSSVAAYLAPSIFSPLKPRYFHQTHSTLKNPAIFKNSLQKTLEAHRSSNRASLIRRIPNKPDDSEQSPAEVATSDGPSNGSNTDVTLGSSSTPKSPRRKSRSIQKSYPPSRPSYTPQLIHWDAEFKRGRPVQCPWLDGLDSTRSFSDGLSQLDAEIKALEKYLSPTPPEEERVHRILAHIAGLLEGIAPRAPCIIGSWRTGLAMSHSHLDLLLPVPDSVRSTEQVRKPSATRPQILSQHKRLLRDVEQTLQDFQSFNIVYPSTAVHHETGLRVRFSCGEDIPPMVEYIQDYCAEYPSVRPLYMAARLLLESQGLCGQGPRSLKPEALVMLIVAFLKLNHGKFQRSDGLGERLLAFLQMYGTEVDLTTTGIAVDPPGTFDADTVRSASRMFTNQPDEIPAHLRGQRAIINMKKTAASMGNTAAATRLCLQNPTNYLDDLGRSCLDTPQLRAAFARAHERLRTALDHWDQCAPVTLDHSLLNSILEVNFDDFSHVRDRLTVGAVDST
ncbi:uncharacterized protein BO88DRAFT_458584 [Aspergillus vadensis CBS 113365]|uniref:Polynucleotide adenylyltransferase n=1 Tax=Aspergillus vadensis (strain CBS 113365 / IMI 142717 / IBT 24658) TaxID=1448311 RepID=A0A319BD04_ASPVC|nr:hypothetical protein BO88DRAFT_458584 [Aspergillus vadensis CBS 113365]PYH63903.1 hypothetical protein BO88DRAFT_458584 [Aspergillus vadensis CBS 113365]